MPGAMSGSGPSKIILSAHAAEAIELRGIDLAWVEARLPTRTARNLTPGRDEHVPSKPLLLSAGACCELFIVRPAKVLWDNDIL
jgi:hypothetical protein